MKAFQEWADPNSPEAALFSELDPKRLPGHIAVIMDGNGRWAKRQHLPRVAGHRAGVRPVREMIEACCRLGIDVLTLYAFSVENWKRPPSEVRTLWTLLRHYLHRELPEFKRNNVRFQVIGRIDALPAAVQQDLEIAIVETTANTGLRLNVALNYGGRAEIVDAVNSLLKRARQSKDAFSVTERDFSAELYTSELPDPDLLIRTSGEIRVSNFLLWQIAYSEIWVTDKLWPDFTTLDLLESILDYQKRERRFGGLGATGDSSESVTELVPAGQGPAPSSSPPDLDDSSRLAKYSE